MVVAKPDGAPLKGATIHLRNDEDRGHIIAARSGADGKFELKNVPAAQYHLEVSRNGYFEIEYGQKKPTDPGATFTLRPGEKMTDLVFKLGRAGVISGRIFDEDGEPMSRVQVWALRTGYEKGRPELKPEVRSESNDLGEFRLFGLKPGRYYISAQNMPWNDVVGDKEFTGEGKNAGEKGYARIYYPNTADPAKASTLTVKEGEEIPSVDILMKQTAVFRIRGRVANQVTKPGTRPTQVFVVRRNQENNWMFFNGNNEPKADGSFELPEIAPGEYTVIAMVFDEGKLYSAQVDVDVTAADVEGVMLSVGPGATIPGRVDWIGKPSLSKPEVAIYLESEQEQYGFGGETHPNENWQFTLKEVADGTYKVVLTGLGKDCYIKQVRFGDTALPDTEFRVRGSGSNLEVTADCQGGQIDGVVLNKDALPSTGAWAVAVPEEGKRKYLRLYKSVLTDQYGHFELHGLAPGKYKLFSWQSVAENSWEDGDFLKEYEEKGESLEVQDGDKKTLELKLVEMKDAD
jgi:Carboxypeptidase regulatory-like domain